MSDYPFQPAKRLRDPRHPPSTVTPGATDNQTALGTPQCVDEAGPWVGYHHADEATVAAPAATPAARMPRAKILEVYRISDSDFVVFCENRDLDIGDWVFHGKSLCVVTEEVGPYEMNVNGKAWAAVKTLKKVPEAANTLGHKNIAALKTAVERHIRESLTVFGSPTEIFEEMAGKAHSGTQPKFWRITLWK